MQSDAIKKGVARAPARAMLKATGLTDADLAKPFVAIANTWTEVTPCNFHLALARGKSEGRHPRRGRHAHRVQYHRDFRRNHHGHRRHEGFAGFARSDRRFDRTFRARARVRRGGGDLRLRQNDSRHGDGSGAAESPSLSLYGGSIMAGRFQGHDVTIQDVFEAPGAFAAGKMTAGRSDRTRRSRLPRRRRLRRPIHRQHYGHRDHLSRNFADGRKRSSRRGSAQSASRHRLRQDVMDLLAQTIFARARSSRTPSLHNAIASVSATGGSTNAVLHLLAIARDAGVPLTIDEFDKIFAKTPLLADLKPGGRFTAPDMFHAGGMRLLGKRLQESRPAAGRPDRHPAEIFSRKLRSAKETPAQEVIRPLANPHKERRRPRHSARLARSRRLRREAGAATSACSTTAPRVFSIPKKPRSKPYKSSRSSPATWS